MSRTILIVDDSKTERVVLNGYLRADYDLMEAASGEEAIELLRNHFRVISAIVLDIVMPGMDGFETLRTIKANAQWLSIPVVITTGLDDEDSREKAVALGADSFVTKPFNRKLLIHMVSNAVQLREMAAMADQIKRDSLTGLLSRDSFFAEAERMIRRREPGYYTLSCMDIENFKVINDQYGTETGDKVLIHIARTLGGFVGSIKGLCGRYMADKFAVLYPTKMKDSGEIAENHIAVTTPDCIRRPIRIRIGRYLVSDTSLSVSTMFDRASMAEEMIKGRYDTCVGEYNEKMRDELLREQQIVGDMQSALENGEFESWFQPQYNHASGALIGAEALVRWRKDDKIISPNDFIPVFEKNGFIYEVDKSVWRQVCAHLRRWLDAGRRPLPVSVNISRYDLFQPDFMQTICGLVDEYALPIDLLRLEITESAFAASTRVITEMVGALIRRGFTVEIDDFGSGYSSLNTLKDVPASILKLDMRFFETTQNSVRGGNIVESVVRMAKWLGMAVIAEGVEERAQADYLKTIGCCYIQGYYYAKPMPVDDYEAEMERSAREPKLSRLETLETLDSNLFWDPKSMETLIFNSYAGGAIIFEAHDDTTELLRINDQYVGELHGLVPDGAQLRDSSIGAFIDDEGRKTLRSTLLTAKETGRAASCVVRLTDGKQVEYVRYTARMIAQTSERRLYYAVVVNITRQREAEQKREEAARQLQIIMGNVNGSVSAYVMDEVGNTTPIFCNEKYYELYGYSKEQAEEIHLDVMSCILPEDFADVLEKLNKLKKDGAPIDVDYRAKKRDGSVIFVRSIAARMRMDGYGDEVIVSVDTDFTEQHTLRDQLRAIIENINGGVSVVHMRDSMPEFLLVNESYFEILGYTKEQFQAEVANAFDVVHPNDRERIEKLVKDSETEQKQYTMEYRIVRRNGAIRHVLCNTTVMQLFGIKEPVQLSVVNDITMLREAQQKERDVSTQMQAIIGNIQGGVSATLFRDENHVEIIFANDGFYKLFGYTKEQFEAEVPNAMDPILPEDRRRVAATVLRIAGERRSETYEYRCRKRDGSVMWTQTTNTVISLAGVGDTVLLAVTTDVTELRRAREQSSQISDRLSAVMNAMTNGVSAATVRGDHTEFLFVNDRYYEMFGFTKEEYKPEELSGILDRVYPEDRARVRELVLRATEVGQTVETEFRIQLPDGAVRWKKAVINVTQLMGVDAPVQVAIYTDITEEKAATDKLRFLNETARDIIAQPDAETAISETLGKINGYFAADRSYVVELDRARQVSNNTCEVCAAGVESQRARLQEQAYTQSDSWYEALCSQGYLSIERVDALGDEQAELREMLRLQDIHSLIIVALKRNGELVGFIGADNPASAIDQVQQLTGVADNLSMLLMRRDMIRKIAHDNGVMQTLMDDTPGGFLRMRITDEKNPTIVSFNAGFCKMLGMTGDEIRLAYGDDVFKCLHAEDIAAVAKEAAGALNDCGQYSLKCRLKKKNGGFIWVEVFGRFIKGEDGERFINAYFSDITRQKNAEQLQIDLLDNLPFGAAMYDYDGSSLTAIHINQSYWKLVKRNAIGSVIGALHPDDRMVIRQEIEAAIRQKRNPESNCRILSGDGSYLPFHVVGTVTPKENGHWMLCLVYSPTDRDEMSLQEMLPIALSTMVSSSDELSYVKDKDLRYICVSQSVADMAGVKNPRDFINKTAEEMFPKTFADRFNRDDRHVMETGGAVMNTLEHLPAADGSICLARTSKFPILDANGRAAGVYCVSRDITAQREKEFQLELLTSFIPGGLAAYSVSGEGFHTLFFNDGYFAYSGYTRQEYQAITAQEPLALMLAEDREQFHHVLRDFAAQRQDGMTGSCTYRCKTKTGEIRWMSMKAVLSQASEDAFVMNVVQLDVTETRSAGEQLKRLTDSIPGGIATFRCTPDTVEAVYFNDGVCALAGRSREEIEAQTVPVLDLVLDEDRPFVREQIERLTAGETELDFTARIHVRDGMKWVNCVACATGQEGDGYNVSAVLTDVTQRQEEKERLRLANEEYRIATLHANRTICRYDIAAETITMSPEAAKRLKLPEQMSGVPYERVRLGKISEETKDAYIAFFEGIMGGKRESTAIYRKLLPAGWRWIEASATTVFNHEGKPFSAIISYVDVTERREKEAIYSRWQNSIAQRPKDSYTLLRCNLSKNTTFDSREGTLLAIDFNAYADSLDERTEVYIGKCVYADDRERFRAFLRADTMLAEYYRGHRTNFIEYREYLPDDKTRWLKLTADLVEYPDSPDVQAYLMFEDIDQRKRAQQRIVERAETDPLTGVLNRTTFATRANRIMSESGAGVRHALLMIDIDGFKLVNDIFGHGAGDRVLCEIADIMTRASRREDLVGRLGGDEFLVFLTNVPTETAVAKKAQQLCELIRKNLGVNVRISASIGIAMFPRDGEGFETLYKAADSVLYRVKDSGKNGYAFSHGDLVLDADLPRQIQTQTAALKAQYHLRRILIVDDSKLDLEILFGLFKNDFRVEKATDGAMALMKLRHYGTAISVVLLDLNMPGMDGYEVLEKMKRDEAIRTIPVIVVSADEQRETALKVIRAGADDLIVKPVEPDILRVRVEAAINRAENQRMRAQDSYLALRNAEMSSYQSALERSGIMVVTLDWGKNEFSYSPSVSERLAGEYDGKKLWSALLSNLAADSQAVRQMQQLVHDVAEDRGRTEAGMTVRLKTVSGAFHRFEMYVFKEVNDFGLAGRMLITFRELPPAQGENGQVGGQNHGRSHEKEHYDLHE